MDICSSINSGTHHIDVSAEHQYMEEIQVKYNHLAEEKGVYIISACGIDCIPTDLGIRYVEKNFNGKLNSIEIYSKLSFTGDVSGGMCVLFLITNLARK